MNKTWPFHEDDEVQAVEKVLRTGQVNYWNGNEGRRFEQEFAEYHGVPFAVAVANGTLALEAGLRSLGIGPGDEVIVTPRTFVASASTIALVGARPVFADVDHDTQNITPETASLMITDATRAIMTVHLAGWPCDMPGFQQLADARNLLLIEDCAQAHGATIDGQLVGSFGDVAAFSFCTDKIMSTGGEGGMLLLKDETVWEKAWSLKDHGKNQKAALSNDHPPGYRWLHKTVGSNWRLTEMQSAIGRTQLRKLSRWVDQRRLNAHRLQSILSQVPGLRAPVPPPTIGHSYYKYYVFVRPEALSREWNRDRIVSELQSEAVPCMQGSCPEIYLEEVFSGTDSVPTNRLATAKELGETSIMFPVDHMLDESDMVRFANATASVLDRATK